MFKIQSKSIWFIEKSSHHHKYCWLFKINPTTLIKSNPSLHSIQSCQLHQIIPITDWPIDCDSPKSVQFCSYIQAPCHHLTLPASHPTTQYHRSLSPILSQTMHNRPAHRIRYPVSVTGRSEARATCARAAQVANESGAVKGSGQSSSSIELSYGEMTNEFRCGE